MCESYLKDALIILEKEKSIILNLEDEEKGLTKQVNEYIYCYQESSTPSSSPTRAPFTVCCATCT